MKDWMRLEGDGTIGSGEQNRARWLWEEPCLVVREQRSTTYLQARGQGVTDRRSAHPVWLVLRTLLAGFLVGGAILGLLFFGL